jgi:hypothetical protein
VQERQEYSRHTIRNTFSQAEAFDISWSCRQDSHWRLSSAISFSHYAAIVHCRRASLPARLFFLSAEAAASVRPHTDYWLHYWAIYSSIEPLAEPLIIDIIDISPLHWHTDISSWYENIVLTHEMRMLILH